MSKRQTVIGFFLKRVDRDMTDSSVQGTASTKAPELLLLIVSFGFSCYIFWEFLGMIDMLPFLPEDLGYVILLYEKPLGFFVLMVSFVVAYKTAERLIQRLELILLGAVTTSFLTLISATGATLLPFAALPLSVLTWVFYGLSLASSMLLWTVLSSYHYTPATKYVMLFGFAAAIAVYFGLSIMRESPHIHLFIGFLVITTMSAVCFLLVRTLSPVAREYPHKPKPLPAPVAFLSMTYGILYGFLLSFITVSGSNSVFVAAGAALAGCLAAWIIVLKEKAHRVTRYTFVAIALSLFLFQINGTVTLIICSFIIIGACFCTATTGWISSVETASRHALNPIAVFTRNKVAGWIGFFLGVTVSSAVLVFDKSLYLSVIALLTALVCTAFAIFELSQSKGENKQEGEQGEVTRYRRRCQNLAKHYRLSARELEVLYLLAQGRNASIIAAKLNIAKPTAKTHIQHIYQKTMVTSQQALIEIVDTTDVELKETS